MHVLLINDNPVISRLLGLCTREEERILEEIKSIESTQRESYDILFVDEDVCVDTLVESDLYHTAKTTVLFAKDDKENRHFDVVIKKPFLPSQILDILENNFEKDEEVQAPFIFPLATESKVEKNETNVLDRDEIEQIKTLLDMDEEIDIPDIETLTSEELEVRKVEAIKEQLISEGLDIVDEADIVKEIGVEVDTIDTPKLKREKKKKKSKKNKKIKFTEEEREKIEDAVFVAVASLKKKKLKKLLKGKKVYLKIALEESRYHG